MCSHFLFQVFELRFILVCLLLTFYSIPWAVVVLFDILSENHMYNDKSDWSPSLSLLEIFFLLISFFAFRFVVWYSPFFFRYLTAIFLPFAEGSFLMVLSLWCLSFFFYYCLCWLLRVIIKISKCLFSAVAFVYVGSSLSTIERSNIFHRGFPFFVTLDARSTVWY